MTNGQLRNQLIEGLRNNDIRKDLLKETNLTLTQAVSKAVALEASIADSSLYEERQPSSSVIPLPCAVNRVSQPRARRSNVSTVVVHMRERNNTVW